MHKTKSAMIKDKFKGIIKNSKIINIPKNNNHIGIIKNTESIKETMIKDSPHNKRT